MPGSGSAALLQGASTKLAQETVTGRSPEAQHEEGTYSRSSLTVIFRLSMFYHPLERKWETAAWSCCILEGLGADVTEVTRFCHY